MKYTEVELQDLIADVTKEFSTHLAKTEKEFRLAKSENEDSGDKGDRSKAKFDAKDNSKDESKDESQSSKENSEGGKSDDKRNSSSDEKQSSKDSSKESSEDSSKKPMEHESESDKGPTDQNQQEHSPQQSEDQDHGYDDEDMQHMHSMYSSMSKPELKAHHDTIRKCMDGMAKAETQDAAKDAQGYRPEGGPKDGEAEDESAMAKSEKDTSIGEVSLLKSELEAVKAENADNKKNLDAVSDFLAKYIVEKSAPAGKAITELGIIAKGGSSDEKPLQKSEIDAKLLAKAKDLSLAKADRDAINTYYCGGKNIETVRHLLK